MAVGIASALCPCAPVQQVPLWPEQPTCAAVVHRLPCCGGHLLACPTSGSSRSNSSLIVMVRVTSTPANCGGSHCCGRVTTTSRCSPTFMPII